MSISRVFLEQIFDWRQNAEARPSPDLAAERSRQKPSDNDLQLWRCFCLCIFVIHLFLLRPQVSYSQGRTAITWTVCVV